MNKVCLVLSLGLLMMNGQILCNRLDNNRSLTAQLLQAQQETRSAQINFNAATHQHNKAQEHLNLVNNYPYVLTEDIQDAQEKATGAYLKKEEAQTILDKARKREQNLQNKLQQEAKACVDDPEIAREAQKQEKEMNAEIRKVEDTFARMHRIDQQRTRQLAKKLNEKYNPSNGWFGF